MFIKTDFSDKVRKARIILECELRHEFYTSSYDSYTGGGQIDLGQAAEALRSVEYDFINRHEHDTTMLSTITPVGYANSREWLVVEITDYDREHEDPAKWQDFLAKAAAEIILRLTSSEDSDRIAIVETGDIRFVVMDDPDHGSGINRDKFIFL